MDLVNCPRCGKLFAKNFRDMCNNCHQALEKDFQRCVEHLRENKGVTIHQLSDDTEITIRQITRWIREGRISVSNAPNLSYPCEVCGTLIRDGHMCDSCKSRLNRDVKNAQSTDQLQHKTDEAKNNGIGTYRIGDRLNDRK